MYNLYQKRLRSADKKERVICVGTDVVRMGYNIITG